MAGGSVNHATLVNRLLLAASPLGLAWPNQTGALRAGNRLVRYGLPGSSDILLSAYPSGRLHGIEAKVGNDAWRPKQRAFAAALTKAGGVYILARSTDGTGDDAVAYMLEHIRA